MNTTQPTGAENIPFSCYGISGTIYPDGSFTWGPGRAMTLDEASPFLREAVESAKRERAI